MTYLDKVKKENTNFAPYSDDHIIKNHCPNPYGLKQHDNCDGTYDELRCFECWHQETVSEEVLKNMLETHHNLRPKDKFLAHICSFTGLVCDGDPSKCYECENYKEALKKDICTGPPMTLGYCKYDDHLYCANDVCTQTCSYHPKAIANTPTLCNFDSQPCVQDDCDTLCKRHPLYSGEKVTEPKILDSGDRTEFETGAVRDMREGKGRCDLMPIGVVGCFYTMTQGSESTQSVILGNLAFFMETGRTDYLYRVLKYFDGFDNHETMFLEVAKHFEEGAKKYGENNWQKGIPVRCYIDSAVRHYLKYLRGDKDEPHDRAFVWNILCAIWTCIHKPELNDYAKKGEE